MPRYGGQSTTSLLDEPTVGMDGSRQKFPVADWLFQKQGKTIILTGPIYEIDNIATRILILKARIFNTMGTCHVTTPIQAMRKLLYDDRTFR